MEELRDAVRLHVAELAAYGHGDGNFVLVSGGHKRRFELSFEF